MLELMPHPLRPFAHCRSLGFCPIERRGLCTDDLSALRPLGGAPLQRLVPNACGCSPPSPSGARDQPVPYSNTPSACRHASADRDGDEHERGPVLRPPHSLASHRPPHSATPPSPRWPRVLPLA